jgi:phosphoribosylamine---glycine ligase
VLTVVGLGADVEAARERAYAAAERVSFAGMHYRRDIGRRPRRTTKYG